VPMLQRDTNGQLLFPVQGDWGRGLYAGCLPDGRQALIACAYYTGEMIMAVFNRQGDLAGVVRQELPSPRELLAAGATAAVYRDDYHEYLQDAVGLSRGLIRIKAFDMRADGFSLYHLPKHYQSFLENPADPSFDDEERQAFPGSIEQWIEQGNFVLEWGNDYWLDSTGEIIAS
jgi:hypothetical protein